MPKKEWEDIQKTTFTRWVNEQLKGTDTFINDLNQDFRDGTNLIKLVDVLTGTKVKKTQIPKTEFLKVQNVTMAFDSLKGKGIVFENIDSSAIVQGNLKLTMAMVWMLILRYSITKTVGKDSKTIMLSAKDELKIWIKMKVTGVTVKNFTTFWSDGWALGGLVNAFSSDLCTDWKEWSGKKGEAARKNVEEALVDAEEYLGVAMLITAKEVTNPKVDEESMLTYLFQFYKAELKVKLKFQGQGLEPNGHQVGGLVRFTLKALSEGQSKLEVFIVHSQGVTEQCTVEYNKVARIYTCSFTPTMEGQYTVTIMYGGVEIRNSPFKINVAARTGDASKVTLQGGGIGKTRVAVNEKMSFEVNTQSAGQGTMDVGIADSCGRKDKVKVNVQPVKGKAGYYLVEFSIREAGMYTISVFFAGQEIPNSPFTIQVGESGSSSQEPSMISKTSAGSGGMTRSGGSGGMSHTSDGMTRTSGGMSQTSGGMSRTSGGSGGMTYTSGGMTNASGGSGGSGGMTRTSGGMTHTSGPAFGSGLSMGAVGETASFTLDSKTIGSGGMSMSIDGPSRVEVKRVENPDGTITFTYCPTAPGAYKITIKVNGKHIQGSPFTANIGSTTGSSQYAMTSSSSSGGLPQIKVSERDLSLYTITATSSSGKEVPCRLTRGADGYLSFEFQEVGKGTYTVSVYRGGQLITNEPMAVTVSEGSDGAMTISTEGGIEVTGVRQEMMTRSTTTTPSSQRTMSGHGASTCVASGEGMSKGFCNKVNTFSVNTTGAGNTMMLVGMMGPEVPVDELIVKFVGHGEYTISYKVKVKGQYTLVVRWGDHDIRGSPFRVTVQ